MHAPKRPGTRTHRQTSKQFLHIFHGNNDSRTRLSVTSYVHRLSCCIRGTYTDIFNSFLPAHTTFLDNSSDTVSVYSLKFFFGLTAPLNLPFQNYVLSVLTAVKSKLGFAPTTSETQPQTLLRPYVLSWLSRMDDPEYVNWAKDLFRQWTNSSNPDTENP